MCGATDASVMVSAKTPGATVRSRGEPHVWIQRRIVDLAHSRVEDDVRDAGLRHADRLRLDVRTAQQETADEAAIAVIDAVDRRDHVSGVPRPGLSRCCECDDGVVEIGLPTAMSFFDGSFTGVHDAALEDEEQHGDGDRHEQGRSELEGVLVALAELTGREPRDALGQRGEGGRLRRRR